MKNKTLIALLAALLLVALIQVRGVKATELMSAESFQALTPYGVPEAHDTDATTRKKPAIFWGLSSDGSVTFADGTNQAAFNSSCQPIVMLAVMSGNDTETTVFTTHVTGTRSTGFDYEVRQDANGTESDVTASQLVGWVAFGWK